MAKSKKPKAPPEPFWNDLIDVYFNFCKKKFNDVPSFDGSAPRDFKALIISLRTRAEHAGVEWSHEAATARLWAFLEYAFIDPWLQDNWIISNLSRQKDKIFFRIAKQNTNG